MSTLLARLETDNAAHELCRDDDGYVLRTYTEEPGSRTEKRLTPREAGEWVDTVRRCGGAVYERTIIGRDNEPVKP